MAVVTEEDKKFGTETNGEKMSQKESKKGVVKYPVGKKEFVYYGAGADVVVDYENL